MVQRPCSAWHGAIRRCSCRCVRTIFSSELGHRPEIGECTKQSAAAHTENRGETRMALGGVFLIRCGRTFWREVIELCITSAAVVMIDVTEISENVIWELKTSL